MIVAIAAPEPQSRNTPLGGLRRLGTVMNRRKSVMGSPAGSFDRKAEKKRSPFAPFKRSDSSREMQIPESPTSDHPAASFTEDEPGRNRSFLQDRGAPDTVTHAPISQPAPTSTNGASAEEHIGFNSNGANVRDIARLVHRGPTKRFF